MRARPFLFVVVLAVGMSMAAGSVAGVPGVDDDDLDCDDETEADPLPGFGSAAALGGLAAIVAARRFRRA